MRSTSHLARIFITALLIVIAQIAIVLLAHGGSPISSYKALYQWDSFHYDSIATKGYFSNIDRASNLNVMAEGAVNAKTNVAFFPAYPYVVRLLYVVTGFSTKTLLIVTAQFFAVIFWMYFLLLFDLFKFSRLSRLFCIGFIFAHPASFFLVSGYSESLFMTMLLGYVYWTHREGSKAQWFAASHGIVMALTRIHGVFASAYPLLRQVFKKTRTANALRNAAVVSGASVLGLVGFLAYCQIAFGHWDLYLQTQWHGWGIAPRYAFLFQGYLEPFIATSSKGWAHPNNISQTLTTLTLWMFMIAGAAEILHCRRSTELRTRLPLWITAFLLWYFYAASLAEVDMRSMLRYLLAPHTLMILAYAHLLKHSVKSPFIVRYLFYVIMATAIATSAILALRYIQLFTDGKWVA